MDLDSLSSPKPQFPMIDEELAMKDLEDFDSLRKDLVSEVSMISKKLKHKIDIKKIKKEAMKSMIEGPSIAELGLVKKDSVVSRKSHKDSSTPGKFKAYYSDSEEKQSRDEDGDNHRRTSSVSRLYSFDE
jgi:hypothetical protein